MTRHCCTLLMALVSVGAAACAAPKPKMSAADAFTPASAAGSGQPPTAKALKRWAKEFRRPAECAQGAHTLETQYGHETGWLALKACVARGDFSLLAELLTWTEDLRTRADALPLFAQVVSARGGSGLGEALAAARARGVPLLGLQAALASPRGSQGMTVLLLGQLGPASEAPSMHGVLVEELADPNPISFNRLPPSTVTKNPGGSSTGSTETTSVDNAAVARDAAAAKDKRDAHLRAQQSQNELVETGVELRVRPPAEAPLSPDKGYALLVRVDGVLDERASNRESPGHTLLTTLLGAWEVHPERSEFWTR